jgi:hypothetical protein
MGKIFSLCANCGDPIIGGKQDGELKFCSENCLRYHRHPGFCELCLSQTSTESLSLNFSVNFIFGTHLHGWGPRCERCYSIVKRKWLWIFIPIFPISAKYRVLYPRPRRFTSRKITHELG